MKPSDAAPEPLRRVVMLQSWLRLTFLHWRYPVELVQRRVPDPLRVESFDGSAWVGVTPFLLSGLRAKRLPALPWISQFPETNCRTYVRGPDGHSGVWFFSLDAARLLAVASARLAYGLPYAWSRMRVEYGSDQVTYRSARRWPDSRAHTRIVVEPGDAIDADPLDRFLTARFRLYAFVLGKLCCAKVDHAPWPLRRARVLEAQQTLTDAAGLPGALAPDHVLYSPGVDVRIGPSERL